MLRKCISSSPHPRLLGTQWILPRSITWDDAWPDNLSEEVVDNISDVLPTFNIRCACTFLQNLLFRKPNILQTVTGARGRGFSSRTRSGSGRNSKLQGKNYSRA